MIKSKQDYFVEKVVEQVGNEYTFLGEYKKSKEKIPVIHNNCGHRYEVRPDNFLGVNKRRCPKCAMNKKKQCTAFGQEEFKDIIHRLVGSEYTVLSEYKGQEVKFLIRHNVCGNEYLTNYKNFRRGRRCKKCVDDGRRKSQGEFVKEVNKMCEGDYEVLGKYVSNRIKITFMHLECGTTYESTPDNFLKGNRCPSCKKSKGESRIKDYLDKRGIDYVREATYEGVKDVHPLRFDFVLREYIPERHVIIEYDGEQHFVSVNHWGGDEGLRKVKERDKIKDEFATREGHIMIRIPYWEFDNIEYILDKKLKETIDI